MLALINDILDLSIRIGGEAPRLVDHGLRQSKARHHDERARGQHRRGESAVLGQLAEVPHGLDSCPACLYVAGPNVQVAFGYPAGGLHCAVPSIAQLDPS
jgi:hypothetical protein